MSEWHSFFNVNVNTCIPYISQTLRLNIIQFYEKLRVLLRMNNCNTYTTKEVKGPDCDRTGTHTTWFWHFKFTKTSAHLWQATWQHKYEIEVSIHQPSPCTPIQEKFKYKKQGPFPISLVSVTRIFFKVKTLKKWSVIGIKSHSNERTFSSRSVMMDTDFFRSCFILVGSSPSQGDIFSLHFIL